MVFNLFISACLAFVSTTLDDFAVMLVFFGKARSDNIPHGYLKVILGQTIGFTIVIIISMLGLVIGAVVPKDYIDLIGIVPLIAGIYKFYEMIRDGECCCCHSEEPSKYESLPQKDSDVDAPPTTAIRIEVASGANSNSLANNFKTYNNDTESGMPTENTPESDLLNEDGNLLSYSFGFLLQHVLDPFVLEVTVFALICSSDNIAIYVSLFASMAPWEVLLVVVTFYALLALNCAIAMLMMNCENVAKAFEEQSKYFVPILFVVLGVYIMSDSVLVEWAEQQK